MFTFIYLVPTLRFLFCPKAESVTCFACSYSYKHSPLSLSFRSWPWPCPRGSTRSPLSLLFLLTCYLSKSGSAVSPTALPAASPRVMLQTAGCR